MNWGELISMYRSRQSVSQQRIWLLTPLTQFPFQVLRYFLPYLNTHGPPLQPGVWVVPRNFESA